MTAGLQTHQRLENIATDNENRLEGLHLPSGPSTGESGSSGADVLQRTTSELACYGAGNPFYPSLAMPSLGPVVSGIETPLTV